MQNLLLHYSMMSSIRDDASSASKSTKRPHGSSMSKNTQSAEVYSSEPSLKRQKTVRTYTSLSSTAASVATHPLRDISAQSSLLKYTPTVSSYEVSLQPDSRIPESVLPADFFGDAKFSPPVGIDDGDHGRIPNFATGHDASHLDNEEWAAFEAEIAQIQSDSRTNSQEATISASVISAAPVLKVDAGSASSASMTDPTTESRVSTFEVDREDAQNKLVDEFEQMENLEERVRKLKQQREAIRKHAVPVTSEHVKSIQDAGDKDVESDDYEDEDEDDWIHLSRR